MVFREDHVIQAGQDRSAVLRRLHGLAQASPDLKDAVQCYETILPLVGSVDLLVEPVSITPEQARAKMERGQPLLHNVDLELDGQAVANLMFRLARALETFHQENRPRERRWPLAPASHKPAEASSNYALRRATSAHKVRLALEEKRLDVRALLSQIVAGEDDSVARSLRLDPGLVRTLARYTIKPALRVWRQQLTPLAWEIEWHRGYCFICGAGATLGELQGNEQVKHLRCGLCGADWSFPRLRCTHCANEDHRILGYLYPDNQCEKNGIEVCYRCKGYLKIIPAFDPTPPEMLPVEDLATLHLDYIAQEAGYGQGQTGSIQSRWPCFPSP